jgi:hypothetical protein
VKKLVSIALLMVFLFNVIGYRVFFYYLERGADVRIEARLEKLTEADQSLITVKIPIRLPYQTDWQDFERAEGEVTVNGSVYRYVKQRVYRDTLILLCINDHYKSRIIKGTADYFEKVNDLAAENNKKPVFKQSMSDYIMDVSILRFDSFESLITFYPVSSESSCFPGFLRKIKIPPRSLVFIS